MDEQKAPKNKKTNIILRVIAFIITALLVAGAIFLVVNHDRVNLDSLKRYFTYRSLERNDSGQAQSFPYSSSSSDVFAALGDDLLICSGGGVRLYSGGGVCYVEDSISLEYPAVDVCDDIAAVYSVGGNTVYLYRDREQYAVISDSEWVILSARLNPDGWLAVTAQQPGYKAVVTVYDDEQNKCAAFRLSSSFISDAVVTDDCNRIAVVSLGQDGTAFESTLSFYDLPDPNKAGVDYNLTPTLSQSLGNNVILSLQGGDRIRCVGDYGISVWNGKELTTWSCQSKYLKAFSLSDNFTAMLIGKYRLSSQAELYTIDEHGNPSVGRAINEQVLSMSAAGKYIAVLTANRLDIYNQDLDLYATLEGTDGAKEVLMREDGSALLISSDTAHLFVPD